MIMIALAGLFTGAGLAVRFSVFVLSPVIAVVVLFGIANIVGGAETLSCLTATSVAVICLQIGYLAGSVALLILHGRESRGREGLRWISTLPRPPTW